MIYKFAVFLILIGSGLGNINFLIPYFFVLAGIAMISGRFFLFSRFNLSLDDISNKYLIIIILFLTIALLSIILNYNPKSLSRFFQTFLSLYLFLIFLFLGKNFGINHFKSEILLSFLLIIISSFIIYFLKIRGSDIDSLLPLFNKFKATRSFLRNYGLSVEPSIFAFYSITVGAFVLLQIKNLFPKIFIILVILLSSFTTQSESGYLILILFPILVFSRMKLLIILFFYLIILILNFNFLLDIKDYLAIQYPHRFNYIIIALDQIEFYNFIFGNGLAYVSSYYSTFANLYLTLILEVGAIATFLFVYLFYNALKSIKLVRYSYSLFEYRLNKFIIFSCAIPFLFTSTIFHPFIWSVLGFVVGNSIFLKKKNNIIL